MPEGTVKHLAPECMILEPVKPTVPVVIQVQKLIVPLSDDTESILEESDDDEEAANSGEVTAGGRQHNSEADAQESREGAPTASLAR